MSHTFTTVKDVLAHYQLQYHIDEFIGFNSIAPAVTPAWFKEEIHFALLNRGEDDKEAFLAEFLIVPFLKETWKHHARLNLFSHVAITADEITVIPDYLLSAKNPSGYKVVHEPLLLVVEAKNEKFDEGWCQALLQSVICQKINKVEQLPIHSIVTTGDLWQFGKLEGNIFHKHPIPSSIQNIEGLAGILDTIFSACEQAISAP